MPRRAAHPNEGLLRTPSWWVVVVAGLLLTTLIVAITREIINWRRVRIQVQRLSDQVSSAQRQHQQLEDMIAYLQSPTFQEGEARLQLGLKKTGERVIVVPADQQANTGSTGQSSSTDATATLSGSHAQRWWTYFFGPHSLSSSS